MTTTITTTEAPRVSSCNCGCECCTPMGAAPSEVGASPSEASTHAKATTASTHAKATTCGCGCGS